MTVKQLKEALSQYPDNMEVFVTERKTEFAYGLVNSVRTECINMQEDPDGPTLAKEDVVILDEE